MTDNGTCLGCCINQSWMQHPVAQLPIWQEATQRLTFGEEEILKYLANAWNLFSNLDHCSEVDNKEFLDAIHRAQQLIALRVARRVNPEVWRQP